MRATPRHAPMRQFPLRDDELVVGGIPLRRLAQDVGSTPFYAYDRSAIARRVGELKACLPAKLGLHYAVKANPNGQWQYGFLAPGPTPDATTWKRYPRSETQGNEGVVGGLSNPGSTDWENVLDDQHPYQRVPHTASVIATLRNLSGGRHPVFVSEYGVGSAVDLWRAVRHYERFGLRIQGFPLPQSTLKLKGET